MNGKAKVETQIFLKFIHLSFCTNYFQLDGNKSQGKK